MSAVFCRDYSDIELREFNSYRLFRAKRKNISYTGFNMGAGENAVLGLLLEILRAGDGALIIVDEIELGLHIQAQKRLMYELKKICNKHHVQIICSTHSKEILECIPPAGRLFIKIGEERIDIIPGISPNYVFGKLAGTNSNEITAFVEDDVGQLFLRNLLSLSVRERINIIQVGSDQAILRHMAVHYRENNDDFIAFLDGDKRTAKGSAIRTIKKYLEDCLRSNDSQDSFEDFISSRLNYLPGEEWPEKELIKSVLDQKDVSYLEKQWQCPSSTITSVFETASTAEKHDEFYQISSAMSLSEKQILTDTIRFYSLCHSDISSQIERSINKIINEE